VGFVLRAAIATKVTMPCSDFSSVRNVNISAIHREFLGVEDIMYTCYEKLLMLMLLEGIELKVIINIVNLFIKR
jgi:hypothetical protein